MIVHDCRPPNGEVAVPDPLPGEWCGTTYKAYLDFVLERPDLDYVTVDTDYGCGVVTKRATEAGRVRTAARRAKTAATRLSEMIRRATEIARPRAATPATPPSEILRPAAGPARGTLLQPTPDEDRRRAALVAEWRAVGDDYDAAWALFAENDRTLLNLVSADDFSAATGG